MNQKHNKVSNRRRTRERRGLWRRRRQSD